MVLNTALLGLLSLASLGSLYHKSPFEHNQNVKRRIYNELPPPPTFSFADQQQHPSSGRKSVLERFVNRIFRRPYLADIPPKPSQFGPLNGMVSIVPPPPQPSPPFKHSLMAAAESNPQLYYYDHHLGDDNVGWNANDGHLKPKDYAYRKLKKPITFPAVDADNKFGFPFPSNFVARGQKHLYKKTTASNGQHRDKFKDYDYDYDSNEEDEPEGDDDRQQPQHNKKDIEPGRHYANKLDDDDDNLVLLKSGSKHKSIYVPKQSASTETTTTASAYPIVLPKPKNCSKFNYHYHMYLDKPMSTKEDSYAKKTTTTTTSPKYVMPTAVYHGGHRSKVIVGGDQYAKATTTYKPPTGNTKHYFYEVISGTGANAGGHHNANIDGGGGGYSKPVEESDFKPNTDYYNSMLLDKIFGHSTGNKVMPVENYQQPKEDNTNTFDYNNPKAIDADKYLKVDDDSRLYVPLKKQQKKKDAKGNKPDNSKASKKKNKKKKKTDKSKKAKHSDKAGKKKKKKKSKSSKPKDKAKGGQGKHLEQTKEKFKAH